MKKSFVLICSLIFVSQLFADNLLKIKGDSLYTAGNFEEASAVYESIEAQGLESADLYYNMGNAYYKQGRLPMAILYYERALKMKPYDKDIQYNLELSQQYVVDKIDAIDEFFIKRWLKEFRHKFTSDGWAQFSIVMFIVFIAFLLVFNFSRSRTLKRVGFYLGIVFLFGAFVGFWGASSSKYERTKEVEAIVFSPSVTIKGSPDNSGTELFILHEGTKVRVIDSIGEWKRIEMLDGNVGWLKEASIREI